MSNTLSYISYLNESRMLRALNQTIDEIESESLFQISYYKDQAKRKKQQYFQKRPIRKIIVITHPLNYEYLAPTIAGIEIIKIREEDIPSLNINWSDKEGIFNECIVVLTNNNFARIGTQIMCALYEKTPNSIYVIHDFDNHHWHSVSIQLATFADVYVPAHLSDLSAVSRINPTIMLGLPCGTLQWSADFIHEVTGQFAVIERDSTPLGKHSYYERFKNRNSVLATVNKQYSEVGFLGVDFFSKTPEERWNEWATYKMHWVAPVFNDLPIRFFDALLTGGIPLVPSNLRPYLEFLAIPNEYYVCYGPMDVIDATSVVEKADNKFEDQGLLGIYKRSEFCLSHFHANKNIERIKNWVEMEYGERI
jgi:hypothetical protein